MREGKSNINGTNHNKVRDDTNAGGAEMLFLFLCLVHKIEEKDFLAQLWQQDRRQATEYTKKTAK